jgi:hypothetical protein
VESVLLVVVVVVELGAASSGTCTTERVSPLADPVWTTGVPATTFEGPVLNRVKKGRKVPGTWLRLTPKFAGEALKYRASDFQEDWVALGTHMYLGSRCWRFTVFRTAVGSIRNELADAR